jgi:anti-anti-sigma regulatory factor
MTTRITEVNTSDARRTTLRVEGSLGLEDAELIERICRDLSRETGRAITLDLADLSFLDSDSAEVLCRLRKEQDVLLEGVHLFIQRVIEMAEDDKKWYRLRVPAVPIGARNWKEKRNGRR